MRSAALFDGIVISEVVLDTESWRADRQLRIVKLIRLPLLRSPRRVEGEFADSTTGNTQG